MPDFRLAIEEVAFALGAVGGADTAAGFLTALIGPRPSEDLAGRMAAASHSLLARELLTTAPDFTEPTLHPTLRQAAESMMRGENVLRVTTTAATGARLVTFFLDGPGPVQHELIAGVVSHLTVLANTTQVSAEIAAIIAPLAADGASDAEPLGRIPVAQLRELRVKAGTVSHAELAAEIAGILPEAAAALAAVMQDPAATWTATLRLSTGEAGTSEAGYGVFTVFVSETGWLFDLSTDTEWASVYALHHSNAAAATARLTKV